MTEPNPKYSFDSFFIYEGNKLAYSACEAVIKNKGIFNPLYIYSGEGMGKSHLISACANHLIEKGEKVFFLTPFEFQEILKSGNIEKNAWVIVDDFHDFIKMEDEIQKLFIRQFESFIAMENQLIFSSLYSIENFKELSPLLKSKLLGGIEVGISPPGIGEAYEILSFKLKNKNVELKEELIKAIPLAEKLNFRMIEGIVNKIVLLNIVKKDNVSLEDVKKLFKKGAYEEVLFPELKEEIEESVSKIADRFEEAKKTKEFLDEKIYVWKMKGFKVERLEALKNEDDLEKVKKEYDRFMEDVKRLVELQKKYGEMGVADAEIEEMIFDPDRSTEIEERLKKLEETTKTEKEEEIEEIEEVKSIITGEFNREAVSFLENLDGMPPGLTVIRTEGRNGLTSTLEYGFSILKSKNKAFLDSAELGEKIISGKFNSSEYKNYDYIFIDDFQSLLNIEETENVLIDLLKQWIHEEKKIVLGIHGEIVAINMPFKEIIIRPPTPDAIEKFVSLYSSQKGKIIQEDVVRKIKDGRWNNLKELIDFLEEIFSFPKEKIASEDIEMVRTKEQKNIMVDLELDLDDIEELIWETL